MTILEAGIHIPEYVINPRREIKPLAVSGKQILNHGLDLGLGSKTNILRTHEENGLYTLKFQSGIDNYEFSNLTDSEYRGVKLWIKGIAINNLGTDYKTYLGGISGAIAGVKYLPWKTRRDFLRSAAVTGGLIAGGAILAGCTDEAFAQALKTLGVEGTSLVATSTVIANGQIEPTETPIVYQTAAGFVEVSKTPTGKIIITSSPTSTLEPTVIPPPTLTITTTPAEILVPSFYYTSPQTTTLANGASDWFDGTWSYSHNDSKLGKITLARDFVFGNIIRYELNTDYREYLDPADGGAFWLQLTDSGNYISPPWSIEVPFKASKGIRSVNLLSVFGHEGIPASVDIDRGRLLHANHNPPGSGKYANSHETTYKIEPERWYRLKMTCDQNGVTDVYVDGEFIIAGQVVFRDELADRGLAFNNYHAGYHGAENESDGGTWIENGQVEIMSFV